MCSDGRAEERGREVAGEGVGWWRRCEWTVVLFFKQKGACEVRQLVELRGVVWGSVGLQMRVVVVLRGVKVWAVLGLQGGKM